MKQWPEIAKIENEVLSASEGEIGLLPRYSVHPANQRILLNAHNLAVRRDRDTTSDVKRIVGARTGLLRNQGIGRGNELLGNLVHTRRPCPKELAVERDFHNFAARSGVSLPRTKSHRPIRFPPSRPRRSIQGSGATLRTKLLP